MANRTRPIRIEFRVSENEHRIIKSKMAQLGTKNMGAYLRKMAIDGYIIKVDYTQQKKLAAAVSRAASNINQICRRINSKASCIIRRSGVFGCGRKTGAPQAARSCSARLAL